MDAPILKEGESLTYLGIEIGWNYLKNDANFIHINETIYKLTNNRTKYEYDDKVKIVLIYNH
jgi:hypothetical protein